MSKKNDKLSHLTEQQRALLTLKLQQKNMAKAKSQGNSVSSGHDKLNNATSAELGLWLQESIHSDSAYNESMTLELKGHLHLEALQLALEQIVAEQPALRSRFESSTDEQGDLIVTQYIEPQGKVSLSVLTVHSEDDPEELAKQQARQGFQLDLAPLWRVQLLRFNEHLHWLNITVHHIIFDGYSQSLFLGDLCTYYNACVAGQPAEISVRDDEYRLLREKQHRATNEENLIDEREYWLNRLKDVPPQSLPLNPDQRQKNSFRASVSHIHFEPLLVKKLTAFAREQNTTLYTLLLSAYYLLVFHYSRQQDITVGIDVTNRDIAGSENFIGCFVNQLVMRHELALGDDFATFLHQLQSSLADAYRYQTMPYESLIRLFSDQRSPYQSPLFRSKFMMYHQPEEGFEFADLDVKLKTYHAGYCPFDLAFSFEEFTGELRGSVEFSCDIFTAQSIEQMINHYHDLLGQIIEAPEKSLSEYQQLTATERQRLLIEYNQTQVDIGCPIPVNQLFEKYAEEQPEQIALVTPDTQLSYGEINTRANQLSHYLISLGVQKDITVGIHLERGSDFIICILAILKAGGAYIPIETTLPEKRIERLLDSSETHLVISSRQWSHQLPAGLLFHIDLDTDKDEISVQSTINPDVQISPDDLAYVIYTSGTTGEPKGVMIEHRNLYHLACWQQRYFSIGPGNHISQMSSISFDGSVGEICMALFHGATLYMMDWGQLNGTALLTAVKEYRIDVMVTVPSLLANFTPEELAVHPGLTIVCVGEVCSTELAKQWCDRVHFINAYGPTEYTVYSHLFQCNPRQPLPVHMNRVPIGTAIDNTQTYILDEQLRVLPEEVVGELYIAGYGIARGYLNEPEQTGLRFLDNPFLAIDSPFLAIDQASGNSGEKSQIVKAASFPEGKMYRTGDLAYYQRDGQIQIVGRIDHQVKFKGFRVDLSEIEQSLKQHPDIRNCAVIAEKSVEQTVSRLLAIVQLKPDSTLTMKENIGDVLHRFLASRLPHFMLPQIFIGIENLPLMSSGKIDRNRLESQFSGYVSELSASLSDEIIFESEQEALIADVWQKVLKVNRIRRTDNFFQVGGDSIRVLQVIARLQEHHIELQAEHFFECPTIAELVTKIKSVPLSLHHPDFAKSGPVGPAQAWFFQQFCQQQPYQQQPYQQQPYQQQSASQQDPLQENTYYWEVSLDLTQPLDTQHLPVIVKVLCKRHAALSTAFSCEEGNWTQYPRSIAEIDSDTYKYVHLIEYSGAEDAQDLKAQIRHIAANLDIRTGRLLQLIVLDEKGSAGKLIFIIHHLAVDLLSIDILLQDFTQIYQQMCAGHLSDVRLSDIHSERLANTERLAYLHWSQQVDRQKQGNKHSYVAGNVAVKQDKGLKSASEPMQQIWAIDLSAAGISMSELSKCYQVSGQVLISYVLIGALQNSLRAESCFDVHVEQQGRYSERTNVNVGNAVGWFTRLQTISVESDKHMSLMTIKKQLSHMPDHQKESLPAQVAINYLGEPDQQFSDSTLFNLQSSSFHLVGSELQPLPYWLTFDSYIRAGQLEILVKYDGLQLSVQELRQLELAIHKQFTVLKYQEELAFTVRIEDFPLAASVVEQQSANFLPQLMQNVGRIDDLYPLSPMQSGILFQSLLMPDSGIYINQIGWKIEGALLPEQLIRVWQSVMSEYVNLHNGFIWENLSQPLQFNSGIRDVPYTVEDWRNLPTVVQRQRLEKFAFTVREQGFDLSRPPLQHLFIARLSEKTCQVLWSIHHLLVDGWSTSILIDKVLRRLRQMSLSEPWHGNLSKADADSDIPDYSDFIKQVIHRQDKVCSQDFWCSYLAKPLQPNRLLTSSLRHNHTWRASQWQRRTIRFSDEQTRSLIQLAQDQQLTLNTVIQGAWGILSCQRNAMNDVVFGQVFSGRNLMSGQAAQAVGLFINMLPVRISVNRMQTIASYLQQVHLTTSQLQRYEADSLHDIQQWAGIGQMTELFDAVLVFENYPVADLSGQAHELARVFDIEVYEQTNFPLAVMGHVLEDLHGQYLSFDFIYNRDLFSESDQAGEIVEVLSRDFEQILIQLTGFDDDMSKFFQYELSLSHDLLQLSQSPDPDVIGDDHAMNLIELFDAQVRKTPSAMALKSDLGQMTFSQLNAYAHSLANYMLEYGVTPGEVVAINMTRSMDAIVSIIATLKLGCIYLPIEHNAPIKRQNYILEHAGCHRMLCDSDYLPKNNQITDKVHCILYRDFENILHEKRMADSFESVGLQCRRDIPRNRDACLIYTSGSQGQPKGVLLPHSAIINRLTWMWNRFPYSVQDICCQKTSLSFVDSICELFSPLLQGIPLFIFSAEQVKDPYRMIEILQQERVTHLVLVPSLLKTLIDQAPEKIQKLTYLNRWIVSGEIFPSSLYRRLKQLLPNVTVLNLYGCTEVMADVCCFDASSDSFLTESVPIGRAISGNEVYLLDENLCHTVVGDIGEIYVAGKNLASGYIHDSSLTETVFIDNPFPRTSGLPRDGERMYRTGDLARRLPDGTLEFIGRRDRQFKLRGLRLEPEEIETILISDHRIHKIAVIPREFMEYPDLIAFYQSVDASPLSESIFRELLDSQLASALWPSQWIYLDEWPVLASGKTDYQVLKHRLEMKQREFIGDDGDVNIFDQVKQLWQQVLQKEIADVDKTFFELGGNSLSLIQLHGLLRQKITQDIQLADLLQYPSIRTFSAYLTPSSYTDDRHDGDDKNPRNRGEIRRKAAHRRYRHTHHTN
ncbi:non-ribosomal peptide synthetase [Vibrio mangrovi]|uniref:Linear gramicidin synthase subunit B n=1 Tax=Vibrio mangrovi TaxID=474394 RepID=A0A1Y6IYP6_9VIBR|nr:non-ribosomal peptide synthetase [Vibrio mangrovi]MDW6005409.1 non-ribosomal peptide synthetase [Vibrio mangrovi]SMS02151.1 Linear gramicidin synthase subunit B [Vibrio mangrovi]